MGDINVAELVQRLGSDEDSVRKMAVFKLQSAIGDPSFADVFLLEEGLPKLAYLTLTAHGNTLAYALTSFSRLLELDKGWEYVSGDLIERVRHQSVTLSYVLCYATQKLTWECITGCPTRCHPTPRQYPPQRRLRPRSHRFASSTFPPFRAGKLWLQCSQTGCGDLSPVSGDAG